MGKAHINRQEYDDAIKELELAAKANPKLPFVHFNLGIAYYKKQELARAKEEFLKDAALEPDVAYNYDQLDSSMCCRETTRKPSAICGRHCVSIPRWRVRDINWPGSISAKENRASPD